MEDQNKTKKQLIDELAELRQRTAGLEKLEAERKQAEAQLKESEYLYRTTTENSLTGIYMFREGHYLFTSEMYCKIVGYSWDELKKMDPLDLIAPEYHDQIRDRIKRRLAGEIVPSDYETQLICKDGKIRDVHIKATRIIFEGKSTILGNIIDITERKRAEEALREAYDIINRSPAVAFLWKNEKGWPVEFVSDNVEYLFGYTAEQFVSGKVDYASTVHPDDLERVVGEVLRFSEEEGRERFTHKPYRIITKDKKVKWLDDRTFIRRDKKGRITHYQGIVEDITDRKKAEEAIKESAEKYRSILANIAEGYYEVDLAGNLTFFNDSVCQSIGYSREELVGMNNRQYMDQENAKKLYQIFNKVYTTGKPTEEFGWEIIRKDGAKRFVGASISLIKDSRGQPIGFRGIVRDITERKMLEEALKESEERFRLAFENARDAIFWADADTGILIHCNQSAEELFEMPREAIIGMHQIQLHPPGKAEFYSRMFQNHVMSKGAMDAEAEIITKSGKIVPVYISSSTVQLGKKMVNQGVFINVTERKQAEEALRKSEERYRDLFNSINDAIYAHDLEGHFLSVNRSAAQLLGYSINELIGKPISDFMLPEYRQAFKEEYLPKLKKQGFFNGVSIYLAKDGGQRFIEYRSNLVRKEREVVYVSGVGRDITEKIETEKELKKLEKQVQYAQRMEAIGTLAGGIAHDFNNLLMAIQGNASLMLLDADSGHPHYERLKNIEQYVQSGADLTRQLLGFARRGKYETKPTDLNELIKKSSGMFGRTQKEITIHSKYQKGLWTTEVDQSQIEQVLLNLYVNAWQAMPRGGELYLETENVTLDESYVKPYRFEPGKYIKIAITDTGIGMDKVTQERIFDPFFTTKEMGRGIGLGLASAYGIIKNHGGIINVYSEKGAGTTFNIYLPASEKAVLSEKEVAVEILRGTETVLLVDDEEMIRNVGKEILKTLGYEVFLARSGRETVEIYRANRDQIDLVILDMIMPELSGGDTFDRLRAINPSIKVLLSSGYSINGYAQSILDRGCNGFIQKPFTIKDLSRKLREVLDKK